jgi:hypothetical protein
MVLENIIMKAIKNATMTVIFYLLMMKMENVLKDVLKMRKFTIKDV